MFKLHVYIYCGTRHDSCCIIQYVNFFNTVGQTDAIVSLLLTKLLIVKPETASDLFFVYMEVGHTQLKLIFQVHA